MSRKSANIFIFIFHSDNLRRSGARRQNIVSFFLGAALPFPAFRFSKESGRLRSAENTQNMNL